MARNIALTNCQNTYFYNKIDEENVNITIDSYFRAHIEYKRSDIHVGIKIFKPPSTGAFILNMRTKTEITP